MTALEPFESRPHIAVGVSGGADSLALVLLLDRWVRRRGGQVTSLIVDHRFRPESAKEARQVAAWLAARGISHRTLVWRRPGGKPTSALQARAREERYRLMTDWCRRRGVLHLALAHHAGDQAETVLMRLVRGAGIDGLAGMSAIVSRDGVRVIRPLLLVDPETLRAHLRAEGQPWVEDPTNRDERFERVRWRRLIPGRQRLPIAWAAAEIGRERQEREGRVAKLLAEASFRPDRTLWLPLQSLLAARAETGLAALARCLMAVGGKDYAPRREGLERLMAGLAAGGPARTLGGCHVALSRGAVRISREAGGRGQAGVENKSPPLMPGRFTVAKLNVNIM